MSKHCARCVFGEGDDVADGVCTGHHGNDTVEDRKRYRRARAPNWRASSRKPNFCHKLLRTNLQCIEDFALDVCLVDTDRTAADFPAVKNHIVGFGCKQCSGSVTNSSSWPSFGLVNGWWQTTQRSSSSSNSNIIRVDDPKGFQPSSNKP